MQVADGPRRGFVNLTHHHSGLAGFTPEQVFTGRYRQVAADKQQALDARYAQTPERFTAGRLTVSLPPSRVEINPFTPDDVQAGATDSVDFPTLTRVVQAQAKNALSQNCLSKTG